MFAVIFSRDEMRQFPVQQTGVFSKHISQTGSDHLHRCPRHDLRVRNDRSRCLRFVGDLDMADHQCRPCGHKTVHGGSSRQNDIGNALQPAGIFAEIIDGTCADCDDHVGILGQVKQERADSGLVGHKL